MSLEEQDGRFLERRATLVHAWPVVGSLMLVAVAAFTAWLHLARPLLGSPFAVMERLRDGSLPATSMVVMAGLLPVVMLMCLGLVVVLILFVFASVRNEKRYLRIVRRLTGGDADTGT